jgi:2-(1,2-epoxy-1,2-dihydrophenyl)acetyl-CoA isomerase
VNGPQVHVENEGEIAVLTLDDPSSRNGLSPTMRERLMAAFSACLEPAGTSASAVVITGANGSFSAGSDIAAMLGQPAEDRVARLVEFQAFLAGWSGLDIPVLVAIEGAAAGGGVSMALAADWAVASTDAFFVSGWLGVGLVPDAGAAWWLIRAMGPKLAFDWIHSSRRLDAEAACAAGIVSTSCPPGSARAAAVARARELLAWPPRARAQTKAVLRAAANSASLAEFLKTEAAAQQVLFGGAEHHELVSRFRQRRK